jgi:hypothetical protein
MPRFTTTLVVGLLLAPSVSAQAPADTINSLASIVEHLVPIGRATGEDIWPGFRPDTIPYAFVIPGSGSALFNWRGSLPEGFGEIRGVAGAGWRAESALGAASTGTSIAGRPVAQVVVSSLDPSYLLPTALHEAFHVFQGASLKPGGRFGRGENAFYVSSYPIFDERNERLFAREGQLLSDALRVRDRSQRLDLAREFVAVRRDRQRSLDDSFAQFDNASEMNEGLAEYALLRALEIMTKHPSMPQSWRKRASTRLAEADERLSNLTGNAAQSFRLRYYSTGPAQARLLDQLAGAGWKRDMMQRNETLQDALARAAGMNSVEEHALRRAIRATDTVALATATRASIARLIASRARQVDSVLNVPGLMIELSASALPGRDFGMCGFDPQNHLQVSPTVQLQTRWWRPCSGKALTSEFNVPSVHDTRAGTIRAVIGAESDVKVTVDGQPVSLADGQRMNAASDVRIEAPRASVQSARANLERIGRTIRITPLPDL